MATLVVRRDQVARYRDLAGIETDFHFALRMGIHSTTLSRVLNGDPPSNHVMAAMLRFFGMDSFRDLCRRVGWNPPAIQADDGPNRLRVRRCGWQFTCPRPGSRPRCCSARLHLDGSIARPG